MLVGISGDSLREAFGKTLVRLADQYPDFVVFDADVTGGTGTHHFRRPHPHRFFQFGIAAQNMVAAAGGFASIRIIPEQTTEYLQTQRISMGEFFAPPLTTHLNILYNTE